MSKEKEKMTKYISKYLSLKLIDKASYTKEVAGRVVVTQGKAIRFTDGVYETNDPAEIKFLENHPNFGTIFIKIKKGDLQNTRAEKFKDLEAKEAELEAKEKELDRKEKALEEGESLKEEETQINYSKMKVEELKKIAKERKIEVKEDAVKKDIVEALEESDSSKEEKPAY